MEIGVLGGRGVAGSAAVAELERRGHTVRVLSRATGFDVTADPVATEPLRGLDAIVETLNPSKTTTAAARAVLVDGVRRTLEAASAAGVKHVVSLSIVGTQAIPIGYYRVKNEQEAVVQGGPVPATIVRGTQFPQLFDAAWSATRKIGFIPALRGTVAPLDPRDLAVALADAVEAGPDGPREVELRGPEIFELTDLARSWKAANGSKRPVLRLPNVLAATRVIASGALANPAVPAATRTWSDWLAAR
jgi:uncharacterized protein YbjT (DUF2867 family)